MNDVSRARLKKAGVITAKVVAAVVAAVALLLGATLTVLQTDWGGERMRRRLVAQVNDEIQGHFSVERLSFRPNHIVLRGIRLDDPDGRPVARLATSEVRIRLASLFRKELRVSQVLERPELTLVSDERGMNLTRALEPRHPEPKKEEPPRRRTKEDGWVMRLDALQLRDGSVRLITAEDAATPENDKNADKNGVTTDENRPRRPQDVTRLALSHLQLALSVRYATGNGNLDLTLRADGQHTVEPSGAFALQAAATTRADTQVHVAVDGHLLDRPLRVHVDMRPGAVETLAADVLVELPAMAIRGHTWGPVRIEGRANPGQVPKARVAVTIPGLEVTGHSDSDTAFDFTGSVELKNLRTTLLAVEALTGSAAPAGGGRGRLTFAVGGPVPAAPSGAWSVRWDGRFDRLHTGETVLDGLSLGGRFQGADLEARLEMKQPEALKVTTEATLDDDRRGLTLRALSVAYARETWELQKAARLRVTEVQPAAGSTAPAGTDVSLEPVRLQSGDQALSIEGSKTADDFQAALAVEHLRLDRLPAVAAPPRLRLGGVVDVSVRAGGRLDDPAVHATVEVRQLRVQTFTDVALTVDASLADHRLAGSLDVRAPEATLQASFTAAVRPLEQGAPLDLRAEVVRLDLGAVLAKVQGQGKGKEAPISGAVTSGLRLTGSADDPHVDLTVDARDLRLRPPSTGKRAVAAAPVDVGRARTRLTYARRVARADVDFTSAQSGALKVDATTKVDLSYPRVTRLPPPGKLPIQGRVVARDFDVAWAAALSERIETLSGHVEMDVKLGGTVGDPQFLGDVRWKNGRVVARPPAPPPPAAKR